MGAQAALEAGDYDPAGWTPDSPEYAAELAELTEALLPLQLEALADIDAAHEASEQARHPA